ncbi:hypothetical protein EHQ76_08460 [Leptospira barantonii]|uniref:Uncharacterized protein n=1 Tax=Leptospira barantonii TaxID=2023184 RepID=A0A5F2BDM0_9LEPT|nr:hypothetical protein EHQ76_08460 [Leptospira barantonii]
MIEPIYSPIGVGQEKNFCNTFFGSFKNRADSFQKDWTFRNKRILFPTCSVSGIEECGSSLWIYSSWEFLSFWRIGSVLNPSFF